MTSIADPVDRALARLDVLRTLSTIFDTDTRRLQNRLVTWTDADLDTLRTLLRKLVTEDPSE